MTRALGFPIVYDATHSEERRRSTAAIARLAASSYYQLNRAPTRSVLGSSGEDHQASVELTFVWW